MRSRCDSTFASLHMSRCVTSDFDISSVNSATGTWARTARFAAMHSPSADFPMLGRAATMIRLPGWKPPVSRSISRKPDGTPVRSSPASYSAVIRSKLSLRSASMWLNSDETRLCESSKIDLLGLVDELGRLAGSLPAEPRDLRPDADQPAQRRHLADDPRVVRRVRRRRHERRQLVDPLAAAGVLELAALLELVDERDRVDRLAARVERERGAVDLRVALPVEVPCVEDFADRPDRTGGEHHRAED